MTLATHGVYPMDTESPTISTFFRVVLCGMGGPVLHTWSPTVAVLFPSVRSDPTTRYMGSGGTCCEPASSPADGRQMLTVPKAPLVPQVGRFTHLLPFGQQVYALQDTPSGKGQHPQLPFDGTHACLAQLWVAGHAVLLYASGKPPHVVHPEGGAATASTTVTAENIQTNTSLYKFSEFGIALG